MKQAIRLPLLLSVTTVFATACTPVPFEGQNNYTYGNGYTAPTPYSANTYSAPAPINRAMIGNVAANTAPTQTRAQIPEAGPLSAAAKTQTARRPQVMAATHHSHANGSHTHPGNTHGHAHNTAYNAAAANNVPTAGRQQAASVPAASPTPIGTVPQVPAASNVVTASYTPPAAATSSYTPPAATNSYTPPVATNTSYKPPAAGGGNSYDTYTANTSSAASNTNSGSAYNTYAVSSNSGSYNYGTDSNGNSGSSANTSYTSYGTGNTTSTGSSAGNSTTAANTSSGSGNNYYAGANTGYDRYTSPAATTSSTGSSTGSSGNSYAAASDTSSGGGAAVQVFATVSREKADRIRQDIASQGLPAIVDQVDGLYKVRVPYSSASQARANLIKVRSVSGTPGAFVTAR